jgi:hypothetical protein
MVAVRHVVIRWSLLSYDHGKPAVFFTTGRFGGFFYAGGRVRMVGDFSLRSSDRRDPERR